MSCGATTSVSIVGVDEVAAVSVAGSVAVFVRVSGVFLQAHIRTNARIGTTREA